MAKHTELYDLLGVEPTATEDEIRKAYRKMALKYHPDKNRDNPEASKMFVRVKEAYDILSDSRKRSMYDSMGEESVKMMDNPSNVTPEMFMTVIRSAPKSQRNKIMFFVCAIIFGFFWFVITLSLHIDNIIRWPWWIIMIPAYIVDAFILFMDFLSLPSLYAKHKYNKDLDKEDRVSIYPDILELLNSVLLIIAQVTYPLRLDSILKCSYTIALLPFFLYGLKCFYMPIIYYKLKEIDLSTMISDISSIIAYLTVLLISMKVDGIIDWKWSSTFILIWFYFGFLILKDCFFMYLAKMSGDVAMSVVMNSAMCSDIITIIIKIFIAVAVLNKISGIWTWKISTIVIIIMCFIGIFALCFLCTIYSILFGVIEEDNVEQFVDVESHGAAPQNIQVEATQVDLGMD